MTKLTVPITAVSLEQALEDLSRAAEAGADLVEVRLDHLASQDYAALVTKAKLPILWTLRHESEGGRFTGPAADQIARLAEALSAGGTYVDMEYRRWTAAGAAREALIGKMAELRTAGRDVKLILSYHDFAATRPEMVNIARQIAADPYADIVKVAGLATAADDNFTIFDILKKSPKPAVAIAMGPLGAASRLVAGKFGAEITFATLAPEKASAPGQIGIGQMKNEYHADRLTPGTKLAAVLGHPVEHSLSPAMHNRAYRQMGLDAIYVKFDVAETFSEFARFIDAVRARPWLDCVGFSVTIPHKTNAIEYLTKNHFHIDPLASKIGAVNTLVFRPDGSMAGYNTDYIGIRETLRQAAGIDDATLATRRVLVLGGGGVSRAIVAAMTEARAAVTIFNRTAAKAKALAEDFGCDWAPWETRNETPGDIIINGTSLGMHPRVEECPLEPSALRPGMVVFDTVYNPLETRLLAMARQAGALAVGGVDMLVFQAVAQIRLWFAGQESGDFSIPAGIMKDAVLENLKVDK